jgi:hypothetical protein
MAMSWTDRLALWWGSLFAMRAVPVDGFRVRLRLPSDFDGLFFRAEVQVWLRDRAVDPHAVVVDDIARLLSDVTQQYSVLHRPEAEYAAGLALSRAASSMGVSLTVDEDVEDAARERETVRRKKALEAVHFDNQLEQWSAMRHILSDLASLPVSGQWTP